jgi:hypothetical protein
MDLDISDVNDEDEEDPGGFICVNDDDDNNNGTPDKDETGTISGEDSGTLYIPQRRLLAAQH